MSDERAEVELPRGIALTWGVAADPQRGPKREMSVERIVEAAVEIADADGLAAVSMAAVAARLGYTTMSLYRYVSAKDDLMLLMQEQATGLPPESIGDEVGWRARLMAVFRAAVGVYIEHPWVLDISITGSPATPNSAAYMDVMLDALGETPLTEDERLSVALLVTGHARWYGTILSVYARQARERGLTPEEISASEDALFSALITAEEYPALRRAVEAGVFRSEADPFTFGVERILDGVAAYIDRLSAGGERDAPAEWLSSASAPALADDKRYREARKAVRDAEKALRDARKLERQARKDASERAARAARGA
ncbi:TetR/AcrR family transcriptional regulator C-terminal domain-containing protein [Microbacterium sp. RD1]|uniref:TetR/AcrR family transcriptional regulator C-terminal domain-containing protein n=1 Tax=Microbacterium sp. RD1 TaxID=3457313 RepID=UPI003FA5B9A4